ncbi:MAG: anthranilate synthase component I family protein [Bacteroidales bacterium]|nr:anthranilate synthase component I family protein [Bacteroidales bacterium]
MKMYNYKTYSKTLLSDLYTPVSAYLRLRDAGVQSALMESNDYHSRDNSRSFIGVFPIASVAINHGKAIFKFPDESVETRDITDDYRVENALKDFLKRFNVEGENSKYCGLYGYTSFNAVKYFENIPVKDTTMAENDAPDLLYVLFSTVLVFNHFSSELTIVDISEEGDGLHIQEVEKLLAKAGVRVDEFNALGDIQALISDEEHKENIKKGIAHCLRGDVFQIVISRRFVQKYSGDDFKLYRALRSINPSPYLFYFDFGGFRIFGSSPETHCRIEDGKAYIDPIAGTTKRTGNKDEDFKNAEYLKNDPKENAEHVMLVDLARNDLNRNCDNVKVDFYKDMQFYSHVIHLVSRVSGSLRPNSDNIKTFIDTFPAGTLSGAPKVRAMQLISEIEPHSRGIYGGCIGFLGLNGELNQAITIRTFVARNGELWLQAGGGIVAKSDPEYELQEVNNKLGALRKAVVMAETF